jgi:intracellular sulfur oxidation DsrE/DsrF family protein
VSGLRSWVLVRVGTLQVIDHGLHGQFDIAQHNRFEFQACRSVMERFRVQVEEFIDLIYLGALELISSF